MARLKTIFEFLPEHVQKTPKLRARVALFTPAEPPALSETVASPRESVRFSKLAFREDT